MSKAKELATPGQYLAEASEFGAGVGTYVLGGRVFSSVVGTVERVQAADKKASCDFAHTTRLICLLRSPRLQRAVRVVQNKPASVLPQINDIVTARVRHALLASQSLRLCLNPTLQVTKVNVRFASVEILCVGSTLLKEAYTGMIRQRDVRAFDVDAVEIYKSFRPADIVRAVVLSLGDSKSYFLSTARNELGVILAQSAAGHVMVPISWQQMQVCAANSCRC